MNKAELVEKMAQLADVSKATAERSLNAFMEAVTEALKSGEKVTLVGFGTFMVAERAARTGRNPQTGEKIEIPARKVVKFKPGSKLTL
ncbi:HU family DNA-binding protein [Thermosulfuriphilus ammonigenes]|uniref:HU family DNA-binding protein n=1 Tax=Thermosulfuriphilus ammonigenes TaxID=1936021 RepID=A0A6G7PTH2_9BACT|nr:HU family DNA-binding protein [Thermosulfuriphilus ammonigenes]MBA2848904.1 DNA-binding protein HU-beta [Thermosulfuriphilus ammonigenes]QIJ70979.1 HU family DNA-binding protein [Thermosulfuriphilus ammonigenes]HFB84042.1 HU family DNA-binding protein [Thermodesulfatator sp.]